ncbi:OmpA family protein, partial [Huaxiibacter chinensis]
MLKRYFAPVLLVSTLLAGCQSAPQGKFTPEQITAMKSYGFNEL